MPAFEIRYGEFHIRDRARRHYFDVRSGAAEQRLAVLITDNVRRQWGLDDRGNGDEIEHRGALRYLKGHLAEVGALSPDIVHRVLLTARERRDLGDGWTVHQLPEECPYEWKECRFQERGAAGPMCTAAGPADRVRGRTTQALCEQCGLPSTDTLCDKLVNVRTAGFGTDQLELGDRRLVGVQCDIGKERLAEPRRDAKLCVPGGRICWVQTYEPPEPELPIVPGAVQFSIGEAIDQVNVAFGKRYGRKLIQIEHARSIEDLMGDCPSDEALQHKLMVLASLMENMPLGGLLTEQEAEGSQGTIDLLERLVARDFATLPQQYVRNLRNVNKLAAGYPRHVKVKNMERAHAELGLPYPVADYAKAWAIVRETFIQTLRQVALHLG